MNWLSVSECSASHLMVAKLANMGVGTGQLIALNLRWLFTDMQDYVTDGKTQSHFRRNVISSFFTVIIKM